MLYRGGRFTRRLGAVDVLVFGGNQPVPDPEDAARLHAIGLHG